VKRQRRTIGISALAFTLLIPAAVPQGAFAQSAAVAAAPANYELASEMRAAIKNVAVLPTEKGSRLSATVRLYNGGSAKQRVPEHELRVRTSSGAEYALKPSAGNKPALEPKEIGELVYMAEIDSKEIGTVTELSFVYVDIYTYPKTEKRLLTMPATNVWYGTSAAAPQKPETLAWGQSFKIPGVNSELTYQPIDWSVQHTAEGRAAVVKLLVDNPGVGRETVPAFRMDGQSDLKIFAGERADAGATTLEAGEKKYIHFAIPLDNQASLSNLLVVVTDSFLPGAEAQAAIPLDTGKLAISLPQSGQLPATEAYTIGRPIVIDSLTTAIDSQTEVALMELTMHDNPGEGFKSAVAKFKLTNKSSEPVTTPTFQAALVNSEGVTYQGARQSSVVQTMNPGLSYVVSYSFIMPQTEEGAAIQLKLLEPLKPSDAESAQPGAQQTGNQPAASYTTAIASVYTPFQEADKGTKKYSLYPFELTIRDVAAVTSYMNNLYTYKVTLDMDIKQKENVVVDENFSKLRLEIVDNGGRVVGYKDAAFTGENKLISGKQTVDASNITTDQFNYPYTINIYETIETQNGTAKRLLMSTTK